MSPLLLYGLSTSGRKGSISSLCYHLALSLFHNLPSSGLLFLSPVAGLQGGGAQVSPTAEEQEVSGSQAAGLAPVSSGGEVEQEQEQE